MGLTPAQGHTVRFVSGPEWSPTAAMEEHSLHPLTLLLLQGHRHGPAPQPSCSLQVMVAIPAHRASLQTPAAPEPPSLGGWKPPSGLGVATHTMAGPRASRTLSPNGSPPSLTAVLRALAGSHRARKARALSRFSHWEGISPAKPVCLKSRCCVWQDWPVFWGSRGEETSDASWCSLRASLLRGQWLEQDPHSADVLLLCSVDVNDCPESEGSTAALPAGSACPPAHREPRLLPQRLCPRGDHVAPACAEAGAARRGWHVACRSQERGVLETLDPRAGSRGQSSGSGPPRPPGWGHSRWGGPGLAKWGELPLAAPLLGIGVTKPALPDVLTNPSALPLRNADHLL